MTMSNIIDEIRTQMRVISFSMILVYLITVAVVSVVKFHGLEEMNKLIVEIYELNPNVLILIPIVSCFAMVCASTLSRIIGKLVYGPNYFGEKAYYRLNNFLDFFGTAAALTLLYVLF